MPRTCRNSIFNGESNRYSANTGTCARNPSFANCASIEPSAGLIPPSTTWMVIAATQKPTTAGQLSRPLDDLRYAPPPSLENIPQGSSHNGAHYGPNESQPATHVW